MYVFRLGDNGWYQDAYIKASNAENSGWADEFGTSVALSAEGDTLVVGAPGENSGATGINGDQSDNSVRGAGAVYVFRSVDGDWIQQAYIKASNTGATPRVSPGGDFFGYRVSLSADGDTLAVAALWESGAATGINGDESDDSALSAGAAYVFRFSGSDWFQQAYLKASNTDQNDFFGASLAISADGETIVVGAVGESSSATDVDGDQTDNSRQSAGAAYVFEFDGAAWSQSAYIKASNADEDDWFGSSLALSADARVLAVGATGEDSALGGINMSQSNDSAEGAGAVYLFRNESTGWVQEAYIKASNADAADFFGSSVALSDNGDSLTIGATGEGSNSRGVGGDATDNSNVGAGAAYLFHSNPSGWIQHAYIKASNPDRSDRFGYAVDMNSDGETLVVAARFESSGATGINGDETDNSTGGAGAVYVH